MISVDLAKIKLDSPVVLASGIMGLSASSLNRVVNSGAGAITSKSCSIKERKGHPSPAIVPIEHGLLNAVGLANPGVEDMLAELIEFKKLSDKPLIASIFGSTPQEFVLVAEVIAQAEPDMIEINLSCPNVSGEFGLPFASDSNLSADIVARVRAVTPDIPLSAKLSLQCVSIAEVAKACVNAGSDIITAINTVGPGMLIDINVQKPVLSNKSGGMSGAAILPLAIKAVWDIYKVVGVPIIGTGGVETAQDALQMIMAGATAIGVGTAVYREGLEVFSSINSGLCEYLKARGIANISDLRGIAHA